MEEEKPHALEMGKEKKEAHEEKAEEKGRRIIACLEKIISSF